MSDDEYDPDYMAGDEPEIDYDPEYVQQEEEHMFNFDNMFYEASEKENPIEDLMTIIETERDNCGDVYTFRFKCYELMVEYYIKKNDYDLLPETLKKLFEFYPKVDDVERQDTISKMMYILQSQDDKQFVMDALSYLLELLKEQELHKTYIETGVEYAKILFTLDKMEELGLLLEELLDYFDRLNSEDETLKSKKLELLVMKIRYCNFMKNSKESKRLYLQAYNLNKDKVFDDVRLSAIINEEGGKMHLRQKQYDAALEKFKKAYHLYQESGNIRAKSLLKYSIIASLITKQEHMIVSEEEAKHFENDEKLNALIDLQNAFQDMDIMNVNAIWNERISKSEDDNFILENLNEILHNIRRNYVRNKLKAYKVCRFDTLVTVNLF